MGTWGPGTFEDDIACDWIEDLHDSDPFAFFAHCLDLNRDSDLDYLECIGVVCTAEVLLGLVAGPRGGLSEIVRRWIDEHQQLNVRALVPIATSGVRQVLRPDSEMYQRWEDNEEMFDAWIGQASDLLIRLEEAMASEA